MSASLPPDYSPPMSRSELELYCHRHMAKAPQNSSGQKVAFIPITPEVAESMQYWWMSQRQRALKKPNLAALVHGIQSDMFLNCNPIWVCVTDRHIIINGQHTLEAIVQTGTRQELMLILDPCQGDADVGQKYALFDMGSGRTQVDVNAMLMDEMDMSGDGDDPLYLDGSQINNSTQAMTWILNNLTSNSTAGIGAAKAEKTTMVRTVWREPVCSFYRMVGERRDASLTDDAATLWEAFHKKLCGPTFQSVFLVSLMARPDETIDILRDLVSYGKGGDEGRPKAAFPIWMANLYDAIGHAGAHYGGMRSMIVWRTAHYLDCAMKQVDGKKMARQKERAFMGSPGAAGKESWALASGGKLQTNPTDAGLDMIAARARRARAGTGLHVVES